MGIQNILYATSDSSLHSPIVMYLRNKRYTVKISSTIDDAIVNIKKGQDLLILTARISSLDDWSDSLNNKLGPLGYTLKLFDKAQAMDSNLKILYLDSRNSFDGVTYNGDYTSVSEYIFNKGGYVKSMPISASQIINIIKNLEKS